MKTVYIIFSHTASNMGRFIRFITKNEYNHVSLSLNKASYMLYSFARHYAKAPFYGGFIEESPLRYKGAKIKVCEIEVTEESYNILNNEINSALKQKDKYIYNLISAIFFPFRKRIYLNYSYTCLEFAVDTLSKAQINSVENKFYSVADFEDMFKDYVIYEGEYTPDDSIGWGNDTYNIKASFGFLFKSTAINILKLLGRCFQKKQ